MKKLISILLVLAMLLALAACSTPEPLATEATEPPTTEAPQTEPPTEPEPQPQLIGISMPAEKSPWWHWDDWKQDGFNMKYQLEELGYEVDLQFADNDISTQRSQIENMIVNGCKVLVIASIDGDSLGTVLEQAKEAGIPVIAYDRLIIHSDAVTYYTTFDNFDAGVKMGSYIEAALDLANADGEVYNIEFADGEWHAVGHVIAKGVLSVLQPYLDSGVLNCVSGRDHRSNLSSGLPITRNQVQELVEDILSTYYANGTTLHAVVAIDDDSAQGVSNALAASYSNDVYPIITGQDCDIVSVQNIIAGKQAMSVFQDHRDLAAKAVEMVNAILNGAEPPINDTESYDNGAYVVPSYLVEPRVVTAENVREYLVDPGYYSAQDIGLAL